MIAGAAMADMGTIRCASGSKQIVVYRSVGGANECMAELDATGSPGKVCGRELVGIVSSGQKALWDGCAFFGAVRPSSDGVATGSPGAEISTAKHRWVETVLGTMSITACKASLAARTTPRATRQTPLESAAQTRVRKPSLISLSAELGRATDMPGGLQRGVTDWGGS